MGQYESFIAATRLTEKILKEAFPIKGKLHTVEATNLAWSGIGRDIARDLKTQKKYKLEDRSLVANLTGDVRIIDNKTSKVLDSRSKHVLLQLPHITERGSYILQGTERQVINQLRWRPGIYASFTPDNNVKVVLNTSAAGTYQVMLDRESLVTTFRVGTTTNFPIYSVLVAVGLNDVEIKTLLGQKMYDVNRAKAKPDIDIGKLLKKLRPYATAGSVEERTKLVKEFLESKPLDPEVNKVTIGEAVSFIGRDALIAAVKKAIDLGNGRVEEDDVESLAFKALLSFEDFIAERLIIAVPNIKKQVANLADRKPQILFALPPSTFTNVIENFFTKSEFTRHADQNNPIDIAAVNSLVTTMGEGGIQSSHAVTDELRTIHPSHLGLLDLMHTPEGQKIGVTNHLSLGAKRIGTSLALTVYEAKTGKKVEKTIQEIVNKVIAFPDQYDKLGSGVPVPRSSEVKVRVGNAYKTVKASQVEYIFSSPDAFFSTTTTAIPFLPNNHANRVLMGDKHIEQSVPLADPDKPLVMHRITSSDASGRRVGGYEELFGHAFVVKAPVSGKVTKVTNEAIFIKPAKGRAVEVAIHHHYPLNSGAFLHDTPKVKAGDSVKENQVLVENNFTKDTTLAMGKNLLAGYVAYKGYNFEDGIVISETAAKKLTSIHKNESRVDIDKNTKVGADFYFAAFPQELKYIRERKARYDEAGIIKKGATVEPGDILIPAFQQVPLHAEFDFKRLGKRLGDRAVDISARWDSLVPGEVVDVVKTGSFVKVYVKSVEPMKIGDKLCFTPDHDVLTVDGWKPVGDIVMTDVIATLREGLGVLEYHTPTEIFSYDCVEEPMYHLETQQLSMMVTMDHRLYVNRRDRLTYELLPARDVMGKRARFKKDAVWLAEPPETLLGFEPTDFCRLIGFFAAEGSLTKTDYRVTLHQIKEEGRQWVQALLKRLGIKYSVLKDRFNIYSKKLYEFFSLFGRYAWLKKLPTQLLLLDKERLQAIYEGFLIGDGTVNNSGSEILITTSPVLADQFQEIALKCGWSANIKKLPIDPNPKYIGSQVLYQRHETYHVRIVKGKCRPQINHGHVKKQHAQTEETVPYTGKVHCINVQNHIIYVRRNGKPHWSGNSMRAGAKGIVTHILPDEEMYKTKEGKVLDILLNPAGIPSRVNTGQMYEAATGKIALKTGKPYYTDNFNSRAPSMLTKVRQDMAAAGVVDEEEIVDPKTGSVISSTLVGPIHFYKLKHQVDTKFKARSTVDESYSLDQAPAKTDESSAQRIGMLDTFSLLSGNATSFLNDSFGLKSQKNDEYWIALQKGQIPPPPKVPFITEKFVTMLLGAGINLRQSGTKFVAAPLTDKEILAMSHGEIEKPLALKSNNLMPEKGGLFDPVKTGGIDGNRFNHISLATPIPNPLMLKAIVSVARLPKAESLTAILDGSLAVTPDGKITKELDTGAAGGAGVVNLLKNINVKKELTRTLAETKTAKKDQLDKAYKRLKYLRALDQLKLTPEEAYTNNYVPIIPTKFRHIQPRMDGSLNVSAPNFGYREIILINNQLKKLQKAGIDQTNLKKLNSDLFKAVSGLTGATAPLTRAGEVSGFIEKIKGTSPKMGLFQSKVLTRAQDLSARSTVIPNPKFGLDEIGLPTDMALTIYKPFVVRRLVNMGYDPLTARRLVETKDELALRVLELESRDRPAIMNRAPSLHKFNLQAFRPRLTDGRAVEVNPLIVAGFNMDFDGDTAGIHVPVSEEARKESLEKLLPSKNLLSVRDGSAMHAPTKETAYGVYLMSAPKGTPVRFKSKEDVLQAHLQNKIKVNTAVTVGGVTTCAGQYLIDSLFPKELKPGLQPMTAGRMNDAITAAARGLKSEEAASIITKLKDLGNHYVTEIGFTVSLKDLEVDSSKRNAILDKAKKAVSSIGFSAAAGNAAKEIGALVKSTTENRFVDAAITSGALGKGGTLAQMIATPVAVEDHRGNPVPMFIENSYAEGHDLGSYIATTPGARKGLIDKGLSVGETGYFNKQVVNSAIEYTIKEADCKSGVGNTMPLTSPEIYDRFIASGPYRNKLVTPEFARQLIAKGKKNVIVRSPITCQTIGGVCQKCFGLDETGKLPPIGLHIGALAGQTLGERATQITLKAFHSGGSVGGPKLGFERIQELVNLPQNVKNKATLASVSGAVSKIEESPAGGWFVYVKTTKHYIPKELGLGVKMRQVVKAGDKLSSTGSVKPQELLEYTGSLNTVRNFLVDELARNYSREQGAYVNRKIVETVVRPLTDKAKVTDAGGALESFGVVPGDILSVNSVKNYNRRLRSAKKNEIKFEPTLVGIKTAPLLGQDFVGALAHERLKETLMKAPALALSTDTEKGHPVATLALKNLRQVSTGK